MKYQLKKEHLINYGQWIQPTLSGTFWCHWHEAEDLSLVTLGHKMHPLIFLDGRHVCYKKDAESIQKIVTEITSSTEKTKKYTQTLTALGRKYEREHLRLLKSDKNLNIYIPELFRTYANIVGLWFFSIPFGIELEKYMRQQWPNISDDEWFTLTKPIKSTWLEQQSSEVRLLSLEVKGFLAKTNLGSISESTIRQNPIIWKRLQQHVNKFTWFGTHHWMGQGYSIKKCIEQIRDNMGRLTTKEPVQTARMPREILELARTITYWRTHCAELTAKVVFLSRPILQNLANQWKISYEDLTYLSHLEILEELSKSGFKWDNKINQRKSGYGCILDNKSKERILIGNKLDRAIKQIEGAEVTKADMCKGVVASKGKLVTAKAQIIMSPKDFAKFKRGDILITNETSPDFVPLIKVASAVVTDVGGITSHAAIVCRELGIPCIVGTNIATKIFKDKTTLEVDTHTGIIKKIA